MRSLTRHRRVLLFFFARSFANFPLLAELYNVSKVKRVSLSLSLSFFLIVGEYCFDLGIIDCFPPFLRETPNERIRT